MYARVQKLQLFDKANCAWYGINLGGNCHICLNGCYDIWRFI